MARFVPQVLWMSPPEPQHALGTLVLFHGYGSNERELADQVAPLLPDMAVASVRGPIAEGPGYAWLSLQQSVATLAREALLARTNDVAQAILGWLGARAPAPPVGVLGVSQGGVLGLQLLRIAPERIDYAINLAGYVLPGELPADSLLRQRRPPVFWGRGTRDVAIPGEELRRTAEWLPDHSTLATATYDSGHEPTQQAFDDAARFIRRVRRMRTQSE